MFIWQTFSIVLCSTNGELQEQQEGEYEHPHPPVWNWRWCSIILCSYLDWTQYHRYHASVMERNASHNRLLVYKVVTSVYKTPPNTNKLEQQRTSSLAFAFLFWVLCWYAPYTTPIPHLYPNVVWSTSAQWCLIYMYTYHKKRKCT